MTGIIECGCGKSFHRDYLSSRRLMVAFLLWAACVAGVAVGTDKYRRVVALVGSCRITRCGRCFGETARCRSAKSVGLVDRLRGRLTRMTPMKILFLHGWTSTPGGVKPTYLKAHGHEVFNPALPDDDFEAAVRIAQAEFYRHRPDVVVGSSRGGAVAMNIDSGDTPLVLLCPAWKRWGTVTKAKPNTVVLHSPANPTIPFADSQELLRNSGLPGVGPDRGRHRSPISRS